MTDHSQPPVESAEDLYKDPLTDETFESQRKVIMV